MVPATRDPAARIVIASAVLAASHRTSRRTLDKHTPSVRLCRLPCGCTARRAGPCCHSAPMEAPAAPQKRQERGQAVRIRTEQCAIEQDIQGRLTSRIEHELRRASTHGRSGTRSIRSRSPALMRRLTSRCEVDGSAFDLNCHANAARPAEHAHAAGHQVGEYTGRVARRRAIGPRRSGSSRGQRRGLRDHRLVVASICATSCWFMDLILEPPSPRTR